jgi:neopullulanase
MRIFCFYLLCLASTFCFAQPTEVYPPNWYVGMQDTSLQLIIKQKNIGANLQTVACASQSLGIVSYTKTKHPDYILVQCIVPKKAKQGNVILTINGKQKITYELKQKKALPQTLTGSDALYLIMPDRFANGDTKNDVVKNMREQAANRKELYARHGGDLKGIQRKLNYIDSLGVTALWLTPFQENNELQASYHGYAITNHYKVDPRLGTLTDYTNLTEAAKAKGKKWILDLVFNHIGDGHWLYADKPFDTAVHEFASFTQTNYRANTLMDPYAAQADKKRFVEGWFDKHMPDLNCDNPIVATYLIQNTLWWIETSQADGVRIDTYSYPEQTFMQQWYKAIVAEYPTLNVFAEIWEHAVPLQSYFVPKHKDATQGMQQVLDFQFCFAIDDAVNANDGWTDGISKLYYTLTQDYQYNNAYGHIIFADNHDLDRFYANINYDLNKWKAAMAIMLTTRGVPCLFYGTEILMRNKGEHGVIREDFKGGWPTDTVDKFTTKGRTPEEEEAFAYLQKLLQWRKNCKALNGKLVQFIPEQGVYVYFRYEGASKVMVVYNSNKTQSQIVQLNRFAEQLQGHATFTNIVSGNKMAIEKSIVIGKGEALILEVEY